MDNNFPPHPEGEARRESIRKLVHHVLTARDSGVMERHIKNVLDTLIWKYTEADRKENLRYRTMAAMRKEGPVRHEHVYPKAEMIKRLIKASSPRDIDNILSEACGCLVTELEHTRLKPFDNLYGWERYKRAGVAVYDCVLKGWHPCATSPTDPGPMTEK